jgi:hypothetical protein
VQQDIVAKQGGNPRFRRHMQSRSAAPMHHLSALSW